MSASSVLVTLAVYGVGVTRLWRRAGLGQGVRVRQAVGFACGCAALVIAFSPALHELSERRLFGHMLQHELMMVVAAPFIAWSSPLVAFLWALPDGARRTVAASFVPNAANPVWRAVTAPWSVFLQYGAALWVWHMPAAYAFAMEHAWAHGLEHLCFLVTACLFWWGIAYGSQGRGRYGAAVVYVFVTGVHGGVLGALLTVAPRVWYRPYLLQGTPGLSALEDQQLAGLLMWIPSSIAFVVGGVMLFAAWLGHSDRVTRFAPSARWESQQ